MRHLGGAAHRRSIRSMPTTQQIVQSIDMRLRELNDEIKALDAVRSALDDGATRPSQRSSADVTRRRGSARLPRSGASGQSSREAPAAPHRRAARSRNSGRKVSRPRPSPAVRVALAERLESLLSQNGGLSTSTVAEQTGANRVEVLRQLRELEAAGRIRRVGQRRGTRWQAISDEDRIRARAAELEARRQRAR
jgi:hypothetical protein